MSEETLTTTGGGGGGGFDKKKSEPGVRNGMNESREETNTANWGTASRNW